MKRIHVWLAGLTVASFVATGLVGQEKREVEKEKEKGKIEIEREKEKGKVTEQRTVITRSGKIKTFEKSDPATVVIKTDKTDVTAELAPTTFLDENKLVFTPDHDVTLRGYETTRDGRTVFVTTEVTSDGRVVKLRNDDYAPLWTKTETTTQVPGEKIVAVSGKVRTFEKGDPSRVVIVTDSGETTAELAPVTYLDQNQIAFAPNDVVTLRGYQTIRDDRPVFIATEVTAKDRRVVRLRGLNREPLWTVTTVETPPTDLTGTVTVVETTDTPDGRLVTVKTDSGERVIALGPGTYLEQHRYVLRPGERIVVNGWDVDRSGRRVFLAGHVRVGSNTWQFRRPNRTVIWE